MIPSVPQSPYIEAASRPQDGWRWTDTVGDEVEMRPIQPGETVELLHLLNPPVLSPSGSGRPLPRYVDASPTEVAVVAGVGHGDAQTTVGVGMLRMNPEGGSVGEVEVFVEPSRRHRGVGTNLLHRLVQMAAERSVRRIRFRLPPGESETLGLLSRLSTVPVIWEDGERVVVEFPVAAFTQARRPANEPG